jgi:hypothetical protein
MQPNDLPLVCLSLEFHERLDTQPARRPVNASTATLRTPMHDAGPMWLARPSMYKLLIYNTLPV